MSPRLLLYISLALVQLAVPGWMIFRQEKTLQHGRVFKFKTAPVDPYDAFRGRYVELRFAAEPLDNNISYNGDGKVWVQFETDPEGFAKVRKISITPLKGDDVVLVGATRWGQISFPFNRYYMDEKSAPMAETAYRENSSRTHDNAYATVRVLNGYAALEELYIDGQPIREFLTKHPEK